MKLKDDFENNLYTLLNIIIVITVDNLSPIISLFFGTFHGNYLIANNFFLKIRVHGKTFCVGISRHD